MPCLDYEDSPERQLDQVREALTLRTRQLCAVMTTIEGLDSENQNMASYMDFLEQQHGRDFADEIRKWWEKHKEADKANQQRQMRESEAKKLEQERDELQLRIDRLRG